MKPIIYKKGDTPALDPTTTRDQKAFIALIKEVIANRAGWEVLFENINDGQEAIVLKNKGSGHCVRFRNPGSGYTIEVVVAQNFSDVNTPVSQITSRRDSIYNMDENFIIMADNKRFMLWQVSSNNKTSYRSFGYFYGDLLTFNSTYPYPFIHIGHYTAQNATSLSSSAIGQIPFPNFENFSKRESGFLMADADGNKGATPVNIYAPGFYDMRYKTVDPSKLDPTTPAYFVDNFVVLQASFDNTNNANVFIGKIPGLFYSFAPYRPLLEANFFEEITIDSKKFIALPGMVNNFSMILSTDDWDVFHE